jgi:hypothetical protein
MLPERYAASGTVTQCNKVVEASGVLGLFDTRRDAELAGLDWTGLGSGVGGQSRVKAQHRADRLHFGSS